MSRVAVAGGAVGALLVALLGAALLGGGGSSALASTAALCVTTGALDGLDAEQAANARLIAAVTGQQLAEEPTAAVDRADLIVLITAYQESRLRDLANPSVPGSTTAAGASGIGTDHDSVGLFQQRANWGTVGQRMDPTWAATAFVTHLLAVPGWSSLPPAVAAQAVQRSAYPSAYAAWVSTASRWVKQIDVGRETCGAADIRAPGTTALPRGYRLPSGVSSRAAVAVTFALAQLGKPYVWDAAGPNAYDCSGLTMAAWNAAGVPLPHYTVTQAVLGTPVAAPDLLQPGDLVFIPGDDGTMQAPGHVGMFVGDQLVIEAPQAGEDVKLVRLANFGPIAAMRHIA